MTNELHTAKLLLETIARSITQDPDQFDSKPPGSVSGAPSFKGPFTESPLSGVVGNPRDWPVLLNYMVTRIEDPDALRKGYLDLMQAGAPPVVSMPVQAILALLCGVETLPP